MKAIDLPSLAPLRLGGSNPNSLNSIRLFIRLEFASLRCLGNVFLELFVLIADEDEGVLKGEPLDIGRVFAQIFAHAVEFGQ